MSTGWLQRTKTSGSPRLHERAAELPAFSKYKPNCGAWYTGRRYKIGAARWFHHQRLAFTDEDAAFLVEHHFALDPHPAAVYGTPERTPAF